MPRAVVLEHTLPDGTAHFDWMIEHPSLGVEHRLLTWRTGERPDRADRFEGSRIGHHRAAYLLHEGPVSGGRGSVRRLASGTVCWERLEEACLIVSIRWSEADIRVYEGRSEDGAEWQFVVRRD